MNYHYYASSVAEWRVDNDLEKLIKTMKKDRYGFIVWIVPANIEAHYQIQEYAPQVPGSIAIYQHGLPNDTIADQFGPCTCHD